MGGGEGGEGGHRGCNGGWCGIHDVHAKGCQTSRKTEVNSTLCMTEKSAMLLVAHVSIQQQALNVHHWLNTALGVLPFRTGSDDTEFPATFFEPLFQALFPRATHHAIAHSGSASFRDLEGVGEESPRGQTCETIALVVAGEMLQPLRIGPLC